MKERRLTQLSGLFESMSVLHQEGDLPVLRGHHADGFDYICGGCGEMILIENTVEGEVFDVAIICAKCQTLTTTPSRPPHHPLPPKGTKIVRQGVSPVMGTTDIPAGEVMIGKAAGKKYLEEIGDSSITHRDFSSIDSLTSIISDLRALLGDVFDRLEKSDRLAVAQGKEHERFRHPLMTRISAVRTMVERFKAERQNLDMVILTELNLILRLYHQFSRNPEWERIRRNAHDHSNFIHDLITLAFITYTAGSDNGVGMQVKKILGRRFADVLIAASSRGFLNVEVKTPQSLYDSTMVITPEKADKIIKDAFHSAKAGAAGQLRDDNAGLLVVGGLRISEENGNMLEAAAERKFERDGDSKRHICAVNIVSMTTLINSEGKRYPFLDSIGFGYPKQPSWIGNIEVRYVMNPYYTGYIRPVRRP